MKKYGLLLCALGALICLTSLNTAQCQNNGGQEMQGQIALDPNLPVYRPVNDLKGELNLVGSNTMSHVAAVWADNFKRFYPDVKINIAIRGSREAVPAVQQGKAHIGLLSRSISNKEVAAFKKALGNEPTLLTPCYERMAVYVSNENSIRSMTMQQLDAVFSSTRKQGATQAARNWGDVGASGAMATKNIKVLGRAADTGSQVFFREAVLLGGNFRKDMSTQKTNLDLIKAIASDEAAIGFAGLSYGSPDVRAVPLAIDANSKPVAINSKEADAGYYPLVRPLQLVVNHREDKKLPAIEREFVRYVFSQIGQEDVIKAGFQAIPARPARVALDSVGLGVAR